MQIKRDKQIINIVGEVLKVGDTLADVELVDRQHQPVNLFNFIDGLTVISIVPDINTKTCDIQTNQFASLAKEKNYPIITISTNSPDDIQHWCQASNVDMLYLSDINRHFSKAAGLLMAEYDKLARTVLVVDENKVVQYIEIVADMRDEPDYQRVLAAADQLN
ncbi:redoxin family protein [Fundicoccus sp. Sow4_F4]|uniref:redoxin family protein n=1 Tax=Fundicoccus sp. Sow4_F4 TaxID=3438783 RepID=UPI003F9196DF